MPSTEEEDQELVKYGKPLPFDRNFHGPMWRDRSCTDVPCLLIFLLFLGGWGYVGYYAIQNGDLNKLMVPTDSFNQKCGIDSSVLDKKYLFFFNLEKCIDPLVPLTGCPTPQVCVKSCPSQSFIFDDMKNKLSFEELRSRLICLTDTDRNSLRNVQDAERAVSQNRCARWYIKSAPFLNRCMWQFSPEVCEILPKFLLQRNRRQLIDGNNASMSALAWPQQKSAFNEEVQLQAMALTMTAQEPRVSERLDIRQPVQEEPAIQCRTRTELNESVIKKKMSYTDTRLAKLVGNMVAHFYNSTTHDAQQIGEMIVEDIVNSSFIVMTALIGTLVASLVLIALMRWLASPILWLSILGVLTGLVVAVYYSVNQYLFWRNTPTVPNHSLNLQSSVKNLLQESSTWLYLSIFLCICFIIILLVVIVLRSRINIAIALTKEGSKAVSSVISTVFFPIFSWVLYIATIVFAIGVGLYLGSIGEPSFRMIRQLDASSATGVSNENCICEGPAINYKAGDRCDPTLFQQHCYISGASVFNLFQQNQRAACVKTTCSFVKIENPPLVQFFIGYDVFGFFWLAFFIAAFSDMVLAATFATWYWTFKKKDVPYFTLSRAFRQTLFYHLGTLAFGSLILAICRIIRVILEYIDAKLKKYDNAVTRAILCCMRCFFYLLETFLRFLNRNAYIMCAIHGKGFCGSAKDAFNLIMRNFLRVVTLDKVTDFLFFLSKLLLTGAAGVATYYFVVNNPALIKLHYNAVPVTIVVIAAFLISSVFFGVYSMAVDTLFLCFLEDCERNDGTPEKPFYMSKQLMRILGKHNKRLKRMSSNGNP